MKKIYRHLADNIKTILFTIVMLILVLSFAMWGVADVVKSMLYSQTSAVEIDGKKISNQTIDSSFRQFLYQVGASNNTTISIEDGVAAGLLGQSTKKLVSEIAMNKEAQKIGIEINDDLIAKQIKADPYFKGEDGKFDADKFATVITYSGYNNERQFLQQLKKEKARIELLNVIKSGSQNSNYAEELINKYDREVRSAKYILLPFDTDSVDTSEENLKSYYDKNIDSYKTDELQDVSVLLLTKESLISDDLTEEEIEDELLSTVDLVDTLLTDEVSLEDIASEIGVELVELSDINPLKFNAEDLANDSIKDTRSIFGAVMEMKFSRTESNTSGLKENVDGNYFVVRVDSTKGNEPKPFSEVKEEITESYTKDQAEENRRKEGVELVKKINNENLTLDEISKEQGIEIESSMKFHRLPNAEELKIMSPVAIAQLFTKENVGDAGISILKEGVFLFVLDEISYEENDDEESNRKTATPEERKNEASYLIIESFANALLEKYDTEINYKALDKMYNIEQDTE